MSNDLATMFSGAMTPIAGLDEDTLAVAGGARQGSKRISIKGGVFRKYSGGKEIGAIEDRSPVDGGAEFWKPLNIGTLGQDEQV